MINILVLCHAGARVLFLGNFAISGHLESSLNILRCTTSWYIGWLVSKSEFADDFWAKRKIKHLLKRDCWLDTWILKSSNNQYAADDQERLHTLRFSYSGQKHSLGHGWTYFSNSERPSWKSTCRDDPATRDRRNGVNTCAREKRVCCWRGANVIMHLMLSHLFLVTGS